jgi:chromosomal replication initiator protein
MAPYRLVILREGRARIYGADGALIAASAGGREIAELLLAALNAAAAGLPVIAAQAPLRAIRIAAAAEFGIAEAELIGHAQSTLRPIVRARDLAVLLSRELTGQSYKALGRAFGDRDHTTIGTAIGRARQRLVREPEYRLADRRIRAALGRHA